jgi:outer membrane lipoprotein SlyB
MPHRRDDRQRPVPLTLAARLRRDPIAVAVRLVLSAVLLAALAGCGPDYSPNTYSSAAVQQANNVDQGVVVGVRAVAVSADTTVGSVTGAAAGGIAGSQVGGGVTSAFGALGGTLLGGLAGTAAQHVEGDTKAYEYIVRKAKDELVSVTQTDAVPLKIGQHVLVIAGKQARIVPDYTVQPDAPKAEAVAAPPAVPVPAVPTPAAVPPVPQPSVPAQADGDGTAGATVPEPPAQAASKP